MQHALCRLPITFKTNEPGVTSAKYTNIWQGLACQCNHKGESALRNATDGPFGKVTLFFRSCWFILMTLISVIIKVTTWFNLYKEAASPGRSVIVEEINIKKVIFNPAGNEDGCQLSLPARTYAITIPVSASILFNIVALIRTAIALKQGGQVTNLRVHIK